MSQDFRYFSSFPKYFQGLGGNALNRYTRTMVDTFEVFLAAAPGLEHTVLAEARAAGFPKPKQIPGGVVFNGSWPDVWRANLEMRGASRVLARFAEFRALHLAQLDKRARKVPWAAILRPETPVRLDVTTRKSKIYHAGAAAQRIEKAMLDAVGAKNSKAAALRIIARIEDDLCTLSIDTSGEPLHRRGHKQAVGKAPLRETLAANFLRQSGFTGAETVVDPMCGSGTFVIEAAEWATGLAPGRSRGFAFEQLADFDPKAWDALRRRPPRQLAPRMYGYDRDVGAISMASENAERASVTSSTTFAPQAISALEPPTGAPGLVMVNPPYGARIGNKKLLYALYGSLGQTLRDRFVGWRVGLVTSEPGLARATGLPLQKGPPVPLGPLKISLYTSPPLHGQ